MFLNLNRFLVPCYLSTFLGQIGNKSKKEKIILEEIIHGLFSARGFNGTWLSDSELLYRDFYGNLVVLDIGESSQDSIENIDFDFTTESAARLTSIELPEAKILVANTTFVSLSCNLILILVFVPFLRRLVEIECTRFEELELCCKLAELCTKSGRQRTERKD